MKMRVISLKLKEELVKGFEGGRLGHNFHMVQQEFQAKGQRHNLQLSLPVLNNYYPLGVKQSYIRS